ncbi:MAG TPA: nuclear transport factor 2 family protein, partial [Ilumatobacteraceae bacterium]
MSSNQYAPPGNSGHETANKAIIEQLWDCLGRRDFDGVGALFSPTGQYIDVPVIGGDTGAIGPKEVAARLRLGIGPLREYILHPGPMLAQGDMVMTEHSEEWFWETGEHHLVRFASVHEVRDGLVERWWDYVDLGQLVA